MLPKSESHSNSAMKQCYGPRQQCLGQSKLRRRNVLSRFGDNVSAGGPALAKQCLMISSFPLRAELRFHLPCHQGSARAVDVSKCSSRHCQIIDHAGSVALSHAIDGEWLLVRPRVTGPYSRSGAMRIGMRHVPAKLNTGLRWDLHLHCSTDR